MAVRQSSVLVIGVVLLGLCGAGLAYGLWIGFTDDGSEGEGEEAGAAPVAGTDVVEVEHGVGEVTIEVTDNDHDPDRGEVRVARISRLPAKGTATAVAPDTVAYVPEGGATGVDTFAYELVDDEGDSATGEVEIDVGDTTADLETSIAWGRCTFPGESPDAREILEQQFDAHRCATVDVPVDYRDEASGTLELFVSRRPTSVENGPGPLFYNPGGPGQEAIRPAISLAFNPALDEFDLVAMDPRGVGRSTRLDCEPVGLDWGGAVVPAPGDPLSSFEAGAAALARTCADDPLLPHLGSNNAARDMDRLRELMGEDQISYLGQSYGSDLGTAYASLFPRRLRAGVFDGASDVTLDPVDFVIQQARAGATRFDEYLAHCRVDACAWTRGDDPAAAWSDLLDRLATDPVPDPETGLVLDRGVLLDWSADSYATDFADLDEALDALVLEGDTEPFHPPETGFDEAAVFFAVTCADLPTGPYREAAARVVAEVPDSPPDLLATLAVCGAWPAVDPIAAGPTAEAGPILVTATTGDVPTPYDSSVGLARALPTAGLVVWEARSHTAYWWSACVADHVDVLLVRRRLPDGGTRCDDPPGHWLGLGRALPAELLPVPPNEIDLPD